MKTQKENRLKCQNNYNSITHSLKSLTSKVYISYVLKNICNNPEIK